MARTAPEMIDQFRDRHDVRAFGPTREQLLELCENVVAERDRFRAEQRTTFCDICGRPLTTDEKAAASSGDFNFTCADHARFARIFNVPLELERTGEKIERVELPDFWA